MWTNRDIVRLTGYDRWSNKKKKKKKKKHRVSYKWVQVIKSLDPFFFNEMKFSKRKIFLSYWFSCQSFARTVKSNYSPMWSCVCQRIILLQVIDSLALIFYVRESHVHKFQTFFFLPFYVQGVSVQLLAKNKSNKGE